MYPIERLFKPIEIGGVEIRNRIVMSPMVTHFASDRGTVSERLIDYYVERAKGGVGLIITEACYVRADGRRKKYRLSISKDDDIQGLRKLTQAVRKCGAKIGAQLVHGGRVCFSADIDEIPVSASSIPGPLTGGDFHIGNIPRTLRKDEINDLVLCFGEGARRALEAGYDFIQIHAGHGYLINNFLSPESNKREDVYGGSLEKRMKFLLDIIENVKEKTNGGIPISVRIDGDEIIPGGYGVEEAKIIAKKLEGEGVSEINVTAGNPGAAEWSIQTGEFSEGCLVNFAEQIKKEVNIPVSTVGRINDPFFAEKTLREDKADLIYFGRSLIADPELANKAKEGRIGEIRRCIACMKCVTNLGKELKIECSVNAQVGKEKEYRINRNPAIKKVLIVGGGPAGMEAARVLSVKGHDVTLYEKSNELGGLLNKASMPPFRGDIKYFVSYLKKQMEILHVNVELNRKWRVENKEELSKYNVLIIATGSTATIPEIEIVDSSPLFTADEYLELPNLLGKKNIVIGGGIIGLQCADMLVQNNNEDVLVIEKEDSVARDVGNIEKKMILTRILGKGVRILLNTKVLRIENNRVTVERGGLEESFPFNNLIFAVGRSPNKINVPGSVNDSFEVYSIGDCREPRKIYDAVKEAFELALKI